jgi:hypothetical protein
MTPSGIEPATFRFVAQNLNHYATAVPITSLVPSLKQTIGTQVYRNMEGCILCTTVVGMEIRLRGPGFESRQKQEISLFSKTFRRALGAH